MLFVWVNCCDPGRVSDGSRLALYQTLSPSSTLLLSSSCVYFFFFFLSFCLVFVMFSCSRWSFVGVLVTFSCSADYVRNWQPRILLGMVDARWVSVKNTTTTLDKQHEKMLSQVFVFSI